MWQPAILIRENDPEGLKYHAYTVSAHGVHEREGCYKKIEIARECSISLSNVYNKNEVDEANPFGRGVAKEETGDKPWKLK